VRELNIEKETERIVQFIKNKVTGSGFTKAIIGLSGGIDSALSAALAVKALGKENVIGVMMPYKSSNPDSLEHALILAKELDIPFFIIDITPMVDAYLTNYANDANTLRMGNFMARTRMCVLFDLSAKYRALVVGTSNKSEIYSGYCTQFGDSACAFEPLAHLFKHEVYKMSKLLNIPSQILEKKPSADLWEGQTDEEELGIGYDLLDEILYQILDKKKSDEEILSSSISKEKLDLVKKKIQQSEFKRHLPDMLD
jgi:NAD+ synthase